MTPALAFASFATRTPVARAIKDRLFAEFLPSYEATTSDSYVQPSVGDLVRRYAVPPRSKSQGSPRRLHRPGPDGQIKPIVTPGLVSDLGELRPHAVLLAFRAMLGSDEMALAWQWSKCVDV
jgi:hypothetical protein